MIANSITVPPLSEIVVNGKIRTKGGKRCATVGIIEGTSALTEDFALLTGRSLVKPKKWQVPVLLMNSGNDPITLPTWTRIGILSPVKEIIEENTHSQIFEINAYGLIEYFP